MIDITLALDVRPTVSPCFNANAKSWNCRMRKVVKQHYRWNLTIFRNHLERLADDGEQTLAIPDWATHLQGTTPVLEGRISR